MIYYHIIYSNECAPHGTLVRGDFISSDREAAAFAFALEAMGALD